MGSTTAQLIDRMITDELGLSTTQGDTVSQRAMCERWIQASVNYVWMFRDWPWSYGSEDVAIGSAEDISIADAVNLGKLGGIFHAAASKLPPLEWVDPKRMLTLRQSYGATGIPRLYSFMGGSDTGAKTVLLYPINDATRTLTLHYRLTPPTVSDAGSDGIAEVPDPWIDAVVYEWAVYHAMKKSGNIQSRTEQLQLAQQVLGQMSREERLGREAPHNLAPYGFRGRGPRRLFP